MTLAALALLAIVIAPAVAITKGDSDRAVCFNNLRLIGRAVQTWAADHGGLPPWLVSVSQGGTYSAGPRSGNAFFEYASLSNEIVSPRILACPADTMGNDKVQVARDWTEFRYVSQRKSVSYGLGVHAGSTLANGWLAGDRNIPFDKVSGSCSAGYQNISAIVLHSPALRWTNAIHGEAGHLLLYDGSVEFTSTPRLRSLMFSPENGENGDIHVLNAR